MHTLLIVDDEEIEREGMAQFIPWDTYKMKVDVPGAMTDADVPEQFRAVRQELRGQKMPKNEE